MAHIKVTHHRLTTNASPDMVAQLLKKAWERYHNHWRAAVILRPSASVQDKGNHTYLFNNYNGAFTVKITGDGQGSMLDAVVHRSMTSQQSVMFIPLFPKIVQVNGLTKQIIERYLYQALIESGYGVEVEKEMAVL